MYAECSLYFGLIVQYAGYEPTVNLFYLSESVPHMAPGHGSHGPCNEDMLSVASFTKMI